MLTSEASTHAKFSARWSGPCQLPTAICLVRRNERSHCVLRCIGHYYLVLSKFFSDLTSVWFEHCATLARVRKWVQERLEWLNVAEET